MKREFFKRKSIYSVREATAMAFKNVGEKFSTFEIVALARGLMARPSCTDGTITRRLRELRDNHPDIYGYDCIDHDRSRFQKRSSKMELTN